MSPRMPGHPGPLPSRARALPMPLALALAACAGGPADPGGKSAAPTDSGRGEGGEAEGAADGGDTGPVVLPTCAPLRFSLASHLRQEALPQREVLSQAEHGAGLGDFDGDGDLDMFIAYEGGSLLAFNDGTGAYTLDDSWTMDGGRLPAATVANLIDIDHDGDLDVYLGRSRAGPDLLLTQTAPGAFTSVELPGTETGTRAASFGDVDGDGDLDIVVAARPWNLREEDFRSGEVEGQPNHLLINERGTFRLADDQLPVAENRGVTFQALLFDADGDGDLDIYSANDAGYQVVPNQLWRNDGRGWFTNDPDCDCDRPMYAMGGAVGDWNDDQRPDLYISNIGPQLLLMSDPPTYADLTLASGALIPQEPEHMTSWGVGNTDLDRDGYDDLWVNFGALASGTEDIFGELPGTEPGWYDAAEQQDVVLRGLPGGAWAIVEGAGLEASPGRQRSVVFGDVDGDGDHDAVVVGKHEVRVWRTEGGCETGLQVRVDGPARSPHGHHARVTVHSGAGRATRWMLPERMHGSDDPELVFGLHGLPRADRVEVRFPDGQVFVQEDVPAGVLIVPWD